MFTVVEHETLGDYELVLTRFPGNMHLIGVQKTGLDFTNVQDQMTKHKVDKANYPSQDKIKSLLNSWISKYGTLYVGSHNSALTSKWRKLLTSIGYSTNEFVHPAAPPGAFSINKSAGRINWFKLVFAGQSLFDLLNQISQNPNANQDTIEQLRQVTPSELGRLLAKFKHHPELSFEELSGGVSQVQVKERPLSQEEESLVQMFPSIGTWIRNTLVSIKKQDFRQKAFGLLSQKASQIKDWAERNDKDLNNSNMTVEQAIQFSDEWHRKTQEEKSLDDEYVQQNKYTPTKPENIDMQFPDGFTFQKITSGADTKVEGNKMSHCVGSYCEDVEGGRIQVYSLRDKNNEPKVTIGIKHSELVVQLKGYKDANPSQFKAYIDQFISKHGLQWYYEEPYARDYGLKDISVMFEGDDIPEKWKKIIDSSIRSGQDPDFAKEWCKKVLKSGQAPKEWITGITKHIQEKGNAPEFSIDWCKKVLESGQSPKEWITGIIKYVQYSGDVPFFAHDWSMKKLESGQIPQELITVINKYIQDRGSAPVFAYYWCKRMLDSGQAPQEWITGINKYIRNYGYTPYFAREWYKKTQQNKQEPPQPRTAISKYFYKCGGATSGWYRKSK